MDPQRFRRDQPGLHLRASDSVFSTARPGTDETNWETALSCVAPCAPRSGHLVVVSPHPDDETLGAGGLIYSCARARHPVLVLLLTDGAAARADVVDLAARRRRETRRALNILGGGRIRLVRLGLPDGRLKEHADAVENAITDLIGVRSTLIAPYEADGHADHEAVARACKRIARRRSLPLLQYPIWAWYRCAVADLNLVGARRYDLSVGAQQAKRKALSCFRSQLETGTSGAVVPQHVLHYFLRPFEVFLT